MRGPKIPARVTVKQIVASRYEPVHERPLSWDARIEGIDTIVIDSGETLRLRSDGGQSPPKAGWIILLTSGDSESGFTWTLYGLSQTDTVRNEAARLQSAPA